MAKIHIVLDTKQKGFDRILLDHALNGKEGWALVHVHPCIVRLLEAMEEASFGDVRFDLRDGLPANVDITRRVDVKS